MTEVRISAVLTHSRLVILDDDHVLPITNFFDEDGDECDIEDACIAVAGKDGFGWITFDLCGHPKPSTH